MTGGTERSNQYVVGVHHGTLSGRARAYDALFAEYTTLHDYFGRGAKQVLHRLRALRDRVRAQHAGQILAGNRP